VLIDRHEPPYKVAGAVLLAIAVALGILLALQYRGTFTSREQLTVLSSRSGLVVDPGSKVTLNGVEIGRVAHIAAVDRDGTEQAALTLEVDPDYLHLIPVNVVADVKASTVFGNKYVAFSSPKDPSSQHVSAGDVIAAASVSTEFNTLFETVTSIAEKVDPIKVNRWSTPT
jgi:phospholipid/cholesterol/gamma-HCH transport system substrate-binding protein